MPPEPALANANSPPESEPAMPNALAIWSAESRSSAAQPAGPAGPGCKRFLQYNRRPWKSLPEKGAGDRVDEAVLGALDGRGRQVLEPQGSGISREPLGRRLIGGNLRNRRRM